MTEEKELKMPTYPKRENFYSDKQYLEAIRDYKRQRRRWLNQNKDRVKLAVKSKEKLKEKKKYRKMKDSEFKKKQLDKYKQTRLID